MFLQDRSFKGDWRYLNNNGHEHITSCLFLLAKSNIPLEGRNIKKLTSRQDKTAQKMIVSIQEVCLGGGFTAFFDEAVIEKCYYVNSQEERVEQVLKLEGVMMNCGGNVIRITAYNPMCNLTAPLAEFRVRSFDYRKQGTAEMAISDYGIVMMNPVTLGVLENGSINYFSIIKDGDKAYSYLILNPPSHDDYYYRIMFKA